MTEEKFTIRFQNHCYPNKPPNRVEFTLDIEATVQDLCDEIKKQTNYPIEVYKMAYKSKTQIPKDTEEDLKTSLAKYFGDPPHSIWISKNENVDPKYANFFEMTEPAPMIPMGKPTAFEMSDHRSTETITRKEHTTSSSMSSMSTMASTSFIPWYQSSNTKSDTGYCGLSNQGATCYLNSLLQTLYMTPEFRSALYNWSFEEFAKRSFDKQLAVLMENNKKGTDDTNQDAEKEKEKEKVKSEDGNEVMQYEGKTVEEMWENYKVKLEDMNIPRQLQKLFLKLNTSDKRSVETKNLTKSFGWKQDDAFTQHDVQELCRVLFDKVDKVWEGTDQANLINELYQGEMKDYVRCLNCGHESSRVDKFLDIPLVIKGFGETKAVSSIQEAMENFVEPETLKDENQYFCEKCAKKCDALKGLKITKLPYLLSLQLKRFDFDFQVMRRIKLNDRVTFPEILDVNSLVIGGGLSTSKKRRQMENDEDSANSKYFDKQSRNEQLQRKREEDIENGLKNGPYVYELFSVLIHRGSALGGHYFAYIKSFSANKWFEFNDSHVKDIAPDAYMETFGDASEKKSFFNSGTNAYMLMYRQCDPSRNMMEYTKETIPESILKLIEEENKRDEEKEQEKERQRSMCTFKLVYKDLNPVDVQVHKSEKLATVKEKAIQTFKLESLSPQNVRLREYSYFNGYPTDPLNDYQLGRSCGDYSYSTMKHLYVETKEDNEEFPEYDRMDSVIKVTVYNPVENSWSPFKVYSFPRNAKVKHVKEKLSEVYKIPRETILLVKDESYYNSKGKIFSKDNADLYSEISSDGCKVFVENYSADDKNDPKAFEEIDRIKNLIEVTYTNLEEKDFKHRIFIDKRKTILELKDIIQKEINVPADDFVLSKYHTESYKTDIRNEEEKLSDGHIYNGTKLLVQKGKAFRRGEIPCKYILYDIVNESKTELFELALPNKYTLVEVKAELVKQFKELASSEQNKKKFNCTFPTNPEQIRIRTVNGIHPGTVHPDTKTLKDIVSKYYYSTAEVFVQILPENEVETKTSDDHVVLILRQFHPDKYELGAPIEITANKDDKIIDIKSRIATTIGIPLQQLTLAVADSYDIQTILRVPKLNWYPRPEEDKKEYEYRWRSSDSLDSNRPLRSYITLDDGAILLCRDLSIPRKILTDEEKRKIEDDEDKKRALKMRSTYYRKEEHLDIKIADVSITDTVQKKT